MINPSAKLTRDEVKLIPVPERRDVSSRWRGVAHGDLLDELFKASEHRGLVCKGETYSVTHEGNDLFGRIDFDNPRGIAMPNGTGLSLGFRHSNISHYALTFAVGGHVFVCSNGMITGEFIVKRKHTTGIDLPEVVDCGFNRFLEEAKGIETFVENLRNQKCNNTTACRLIVETGRQNLMPWASLNKVQQLWFEPNHDEFKPRNRWSLYNSFTEVIRDRGNPGTQMQELKKVGLFLNDPKLN